MLLRAINREKFPRELNKPRTINSMKDSILLATAAHAIDFGYIEGALRRSEAMRNSEVDPVEPPTVGELEEALGEAVEKLEEPGLSNRACARRFRPRETAGHRDGRNAPTSVRRAARPGGIADSQIARAEYVCVAPRKANATDRVCAG